MSDKRNVVWAGTLYNVVTLAVDGFNETGVRCHNPQAGVGRSEIHRSASPQMVAHARSVALVFNLIELDAVG